MRAAILIAALLAAPMAHADDTPAQADAPLVLEITGGEATTTGGSKVTLDHGLYLNDVAALELAKRIQAEHTELAELRKDAASGGNAPVVIIVTAAVLSFAAGIALVKLTK